MSWILHFSTGVEMAKKSKKSIKLVTSKPQKIKAEIIPIDQEGYKALKEFTEKYECGEIIDAIIVYDMGDSDPLVLPITDTSYEHFFWMLHQAAIGLAMEGRDAEEEED